MEANGKYINAVPLYRQEKELERYGAVITSQRSFRNLSNRSIVVDVLAQNEEKERVNLEIQLKDSVNHVKRVRYYAASIDIETLEKSKEFVELPKLYMIYISKKDF